jgi:hypothetical protein
MATQGRAKPDGTRRRKTDTATSSPVEASAVAPAAVEIIEPAAADTSSGDAELLDDRTLAIAGSRRGFSLGRALPGAVVGSLLVVGLAFGAAGPGGALGPKSTDGKDPAGPGGPSVVTTAGGEAPAGAHLGDGGDIEADDTGGIKDEPDDVGDDPTVKPDPGEDGKDGTDEDGTGGKEDGDGDGDRDKPKKDQEPDPTRKPQPGETRKPAEDPDADPQPGDVDPIALALGIKDQHPIIEWGSCAGLDFDYYKVVRSKDPTVSWPTGSGDELIAAVERDGYRKAWDKYAPHGDKVWYRVFCVRKTEAGYKVVNASVVKGIEVPEETPPPDPIGLDLDAAIDEEGKVVLTWEACAVEGFAFYKVVRSDSNENPSYLPWTDGSEVIGVVEALHDTEWHDWAPDPGDTAYYRVQCIGYHDGQKVLLGQSAVVTVTMP